MAEEARRFFSGRGLACPFRVHCGTREGWRTSSKMAVRGDPPVVGMFEEGSHRIVECLSSPSHAPEIDRGLQIIVPLLRRARISGYDEQTGGGELRYLVLRTTDARALELTLVWNVSQTPLAEAEVPAKLLQLLKHLQVPSRPHSNNSEGGVVGCLWHSVWLHLHDGNKHTNAIFSYKPDTWRLLWGSRLTLQRLPVGMPAAQLPTLHFLPSVFRQANTEGFVPILDSIREHLHPGTRRLVELYGGVGTIGLHLLDLVSTSFVCSDENPHNRECFDASLQLLSDKSRLKSQYVPKNAADMVTSGELFKQPLDVLLVDPPRKGLDPEVVAALGTPCQFHFNPARNGGRGCRQGAKCRFSHFSASHMPKQLVYVSCGFKALQRDVKALEERGWKIDFAEGHVLFPGADHIETLVIMSAPAHVTGISSSGSLWGPRK